MHSRCCTKQSAHSNDVVPGELQDGEAQDMQEVLRFGLNLMLFYSCKSTSQNESSPEDGHPPPGLSLADLDELEYVRDLNLPTV